MTPLIATEEEIHAIRGFFPHVFFLGGQEVMFRSFGTCGGEATGAFFVTKDQNEGMPFPHQAKFLLGRKSLEFARAALQLPIVGEP